MSVSKVNDYKLLVSSYINETDYFVFSSVREVINAFSMLEPNP